MAATRQTRALRASRGCIGGARLGGRRVRAATLGRRQVRTLALKAVPPAGVSTLFLTGMRDGGEYDGAAGR